MFHLESADWIPEKAKEILKITVKILWLMIRTINNIVL